MRSIRIPAAILSGAGLLIGSAVTAPALAAEQAPAAQQSQASSYSDEKIQSFVTAALEVEQVRQEYSAQFAEAESEEQRQAIAQQANDEMVKAVEDAPGISLQEYNQIAQAVERDPALSQRVAERMEPQMQ
jgi:hypothetical protein